MKKLISLALALTLLAAAFAVAAPVAAATCAAVYVVKPGDTLRQIGLAYGTTWQVLAAANAIPNPNVIYVGQAICIPGAPSAPSYPVPVFTIVKVVRDSSVTIQTANFPAGQAFKVTMGPIGTRGVNGTSVGTTNSGSGGSFSATYNIPNNLKGSYQISIRLESTTGYFSYNWFYNATTP